MSEPAARKTIWAVCDQGVVSAGNFCTNLVLIRHLPASIFGVFALLLNALLFLNNIHASMVTYTVLIRGARTEEQNLGKVATGGVLATLGLSLLNILAIFLATSYVGHRELLFLVLTASVCWQTQEVLRTVFVSHLAYERAIGGDALSYVGQAVVIGWLSFRGTLGLRSIFVAMIATSLVAAVGQGVQIRLKVISWDWLRRFRDDVWTLGRWSVLAKLVAFFSLQAFPWVLAYRHGLVSVAAFQSLFQLVALTNPILLSTNNLIMASVAKSGGIGRSAVENAKKYIFYSAGLAGLYFSVLLLGGSKVLEVFYGRHSGYVLNAPLLHIFVVAYALEFVSMYAGAILAGMEKTRPLFIQQLWGMVVAVCVVLPWIAHSGLFGAVAGLVVVNITKTAAGWYMVYVTRNDQGGRGRKQGVAEFGRAEFLQPYDDTV